VWRTLLAGKINRFTTTSEKRRDNREIDQKKTYEEKGERDERVEL